MRKIKLFYGGSFDPVHIGHARLAIEIIQSVNAESFSFVPCKVWPAKVANRQRSVVGDHHRLAMLSLLVKDLASVASSTKVSLSVESLELDRKGPSYTVDSVASLCDKHPEYQIVWVMGMDAWLSLCHWKQWQDMTDRSSLLVVNRPNYPDWKQISQEQMRWCQERIVNVECLGSNGKIAFLETPPLTVSSSVIRSIVQTEESAQYLVPNSVLEYIEANGLYKTN